MKKLADRVHMLELTMNFIGNQSVIHPVLLQDGEKTFLVDAGMPGQLGQIEAELSQANASLSDLKSRHPHASGHRPYWEPPRTSQSRESSSRSVGSRA